MDTNKATVKDNEQVNAQHLWTNMTDDLRFAKAQQWNVSYYSFLVYVAVVGFYALMDGPCNISNLGLNMVLTCFTFVATLFSAIYLASFQNWIRKCRRNLNFIYDAEKQYTTAVFQEIYEKMNPAKKLDEGFLKSGEILVGLLILHCFSAGAVYWFIWQATILNSLIFAASTFAAEVIAILIYLSWIGRSETKYKFT